MLIVDITFDQIKENPNYYLNELLQGTPDPYLLYQFGPYLITHTDCTNKRLKISYDSESPEICVIRMMMDINALSLIFHGNKRYDEASQNIVSILRDLPTRQQQLQLYGTPLKCIESVRSYGAKCIDRLHDAYITNKWNTTDVISTDKIFESVLTTYSPIVPYTQTLKKADITDTNCIFASKDQSSEYVESLSKNVAIKLLSTIEYYDTHQRDDQMWYEYEELTEYLCKYTPIILNSSDLVINTENHIITAQDTYFPPNQIGKWIEDDILSGDKNDIAKEYFLVSYCFFQFNHDFYIGMAKLLENNYYSYKDSIENMTKNNTPVVEALMSFWEGFALPALEETLLDDDTTKNMEFENQIKMEKILHMADAVNDSDEVSKRPNMDKLLSYMAVNQRYKANEYNNSVFINSNPTFQNISYYNELLIAEVDTSRTCTPVIDVVDGYAPKIILIDDNNDSSIQIIPGLIVRNDE